MMGKKENQMKMILINIGEMIPENHLLKRIDKHVKFDFIYEKVKDLYTVKGKKCPNLS